MVYSQKTINMAQLIADNCTQCGRCMKDCVFLQQYCANPKELFKKFLTSGLPTIVPYSCQLCGHCTVVCPLRLELGQAFLAMRQDLCRDQKKLPLKQLRSVTLHQRLSASRLFSSISGRHSR
ncbi:hypothetical protein FC83_GL001792 [Agrilactobacillus composti DSM 18527 = JCM 14202]|uniref:4Fe-4S ferredoxin-type domain-containing protein n=1 Tax=Agrilactobacillus composti DSM 18527 = JCM 14202 TaxID=1423734 RepID=A0A0R1XKE2_9LACO|nr:4Fe-4S dicluster domain-containing protein [Agrilactobacillus composti]KRM30656.1 hypothetical protein FC83_GL001792 [Agrilactobacillus composti DSM 18527 = JCM 14202]